MSRRPELIKRPEVEHFREVNQQVAAGRVVSRSERMAMIRQQFPSVTKLEWERAFDEDYGLLGKVIRDILRLDVPQSSKSGPRSVPSGAEGSAALHRLLKDDFGTLPFHEMFEVLQGKLSVRGLANKVGISKSQVSRLLAGQTHPTAAEMQLVAAAFKKHPSYFVEWRAAVVATAIRERLTGVPEASITAYRQISSRP